MPKATFQVYSDVNTKVVSGYIEAKPGGGAGRVSTEKVDNVMGSCAGAGSGEFHMYLNSRNRENFRLESIDAQRKLEAEELQFKEKIALNKKLDEERTTKNAQKRLRLKLKKETNRKKPKTNSDNNAVASDDEADSDNDEEQKENEGK